jgi:hypothetical protein
MEVVPDRQVPPNVVVNVLVDLDLNLVVRNRRFGSEDGGRGVRYVIGRRCLPHTSGQHPGLGRLHRRVPLVVSQLQVADRLPVTGLACRLLHIHEARPYTDHEPRHRSTAQHSYPQACVSLGVSTVSARPQLPHLGLQTDTPTISTPSCGTQGKGPTEKDPNHGHLAGGLLHPEGAAAQQCAVATRPGGEIPPGHPTVLGCQRLQQRAGDRGRDHRSVHRRQFRTRAEARLKIATWITDLVGHRRCHPALGYRSSPLRTKPRIDYAATDRGTIRCPHPGRTAQLGGGCR